MTSSNSTTSITFRMTVSEVEVAPDYLDLDDGVTAEQVVAALRDAEKTRGRALNAWDLLDDVDMYVMVDVVGDDGVTTTTTAEWSERTERAERRGQR